MARSTLVPPSFSNLEAGRAVHSGTGVPAGGGTPRHLPAHGTSIGIDLHGEVLGAPQSPARTTIHPRRLLGLARAPTSQAGPIFDLGTRTCWHRWPSSLHQLSRSHRIKSFFRITNLHVLQLQWQVRLRCEYRAVLVLSQGHVSLLHRDA